MAYVKQNFETGQTLTADMLNHIEAGFDGVQDKLVSGTNIKTVNGKSLLGSGNIPIEGSKAKPMPIILDTDWWTDIDDAVAIKILVWAEREGLCDILGLIVNAVNDNSAQSLARYLDYLGRGDLPFALEKNATDYNGNPSYFSTMISSWNHGLYSSNLECPDENEGEYYISLLQSLPSDEKCNIVCIGYLSALAGLFNRAKEDQSIYNLIVNKVNKVFIMAGKYPSGSENNFTRTARSRKAGYDVCTNCPSEIPMIFLGYEVGETVLSGGTTGSVIGTFDLLYKGMVAHGEGSKGRSSWDPMTMLLALMDNENMSGYQYVRGTNVVNASTGANVFTKNEDGNHYYVVKKYADAWYAHQINSIVEQRAWKFREIGRVQYNPDITSYTLQSIAITTQPNKLTYYVDESFNTSGMVVTATLQSESGETAMKTVYDYTYAPTILTQVGDNTITVYYTINGVTKTASVNVSVKERETYFITVDVANGAYGGDETIVSGGSASVTLSANDGYALPNTVTVTGAEYQYNSSTGVISLSNPTSAVSITAECVKIETYNISTEVTNGTYGGDTTIISGGTASVTITANDGYTLPSSVTVTGASYQYDKSKGVVSLSAPTSAVTIVVECVESVVSVGYATVTFDGSENWEFNTSTNPNTYGFYNAYLLNPDVTNPATVTHLGIGYFEEATCNIEVLNRNIVGESRSDTTQCGFGYYSVDPSVFVRFDSSIATSVATFKAWLAENNLTITYKLIS